MSHSLHAEPSPAPLSLSGKALRDLLPHRPPFLLVDALENVVPGVSAEGVRVVPQDDPWARGFAPGEPAMPGILMLEALAQTGAAVVLLTLPDGAGRLVYFAGVERASFHGAAAPGERIRLRVRCIGRRGDLWRFDGTATVDERLMLEARVSAAVAPRGAA
jgi:3-hydroxyacyl-[acyl-carrier-protein] dehydratase